MQLAAVFNEMEESLKDSDFATRHRTVATLALAHSWIIPARLAPLLNDPNRHSDR
jgi:hypothetical protein